MDSQTQIYIRGFPKSTTSNQLREFFNEYTSIQGVRIIRDYAFIDFNQSDDAQKAVKDKQGKEFQGKTLKVEIAGKAKKSKGPQPNDQCRFCGKLGHWKKDCAKLLKERRKRYRSQSDSRDRHRKSRKKSKNKKRKDSYSESSSSSSSSDSSSSSISSDSRSSSNRSRERKKSNKRKDDK